MNIPLLRLNFTESEIDEFQAGIKDIFKNGHLTMGDHTKNFESSFAAWNKSKYALATNSGTSSLEIPLRAIGVEGKIVLCPSNTYMATPIAAIHAGAKVQFIDSDVNNMQISYEHLQQILTGAKNSSSIGALIVVHIGGIITNRFSEIKKLCDSYGIPIIEDAAHAHGATIDGIRAGNLAYAGSFSFYPTKILVTGEGGMVTTSDAGCIERGIILREHGKQDHKFNIHTEFGYNWRISEFHSLLGVMQVRKADQIVSERRRLAKLYDSLLENVEGIKKIRLPENIKASYYKYICFLDDKIDRTKIKNLLSTQYKVSLTGEVYSAPCHLQPVFKTNSEKMILDNYSSFEATKYVCNHHICLPLYPGLTNEEVHYVVDSLQNALAKI